MKNAVRRVRKSFPPIASKTVATHCKQTYLFYCQYYCFMNNLARFRSHLSEQTGKSWGGGAKEFIWRGRERMGERGKERARVAQ